MVASYRWSLVSSSYSALLSGISIISQVLSARVPDSLVFLEWNCPRSNTSQSWGLLSPSALQFTPRTLKMSQMHVVSTFLGMIISYIN